MSYNNASILIVDDEEPNRDILSRRLSKDGYTVSVAEGGKQALDMMRIERYDLVLLDIMMPGVDGYQVLQRIKSEQVLHDIPVIMVTAVNDEPTVKRCLELGAIDHIGKPFELSFLKSRIWQAIKTLGRTRRPGDEQPASSTAVTVLVIDDDELNRDLLIRRFNKAGHDVHVAASGAEALALLNKRRYDLILLDIMMPKMDGVEVLEKIRSRRALTDIPVVMISAINDTATMERCMQLGADEYIMKPYNALVLKERVLALLNEKRRQNLLDD
jgi:CheY-like chemotaxis protein